jgi:lipopolysaccharide export system permease protein
MSILTRYLLRAHLGPFCFAFLALTGVMLVNTVVRRLAELSGKGIPAEVLGEFFLLSLPPVVALTLPMSVLVAVLYTFAQLAAENEITALRASGVDLRRMGLPLLAAAGMITGGMVWFNDRVLPETNQRLATLIADLARTSPLLAFREQALNPIRTPEGTAYLQARRIEVGSGRLRDVAIFDAREPNTGRTIYADSGRMALDRGRTVLHLTLYDGHMRRLDFARPEEFQRLGFHSYRMRMPDVAQRLQRTESDRRDDRSMTVAMMRARIDTLRAEVGRPAPETDFQRRQIRALQVEIHKKYSIAAATLIFVLLGVPLALRFPHGGLGMVISLSIPIFGLYYLGLEGGETLADAGYAPPALAMWIVNALLGTVGTALLLRLGRERSTARGG